jgi:hypothetical protein
LFKSLLQEKPKAKHFYLLQKWSAIQDFWRSKLLSHATPALFKAFYTWRRKDDISNHTLHKDIVLIRQILKNTVLNGLLAQLPPIPPTGTIVPNPRPWFTIKEYNHLVDTARERIVSAPNKRTAEQRRDVHEIVGFLHDSMMRVGELYNLRYRDCRLQLNKDGDEMLLCEVRGKRGVRTCVARADAAAVYRQRNERFKPKPDDLMFSEKHTDAFRELLIAANLRTDANGFERNLKSVRATAVSHMLLQNPHLNLTLLARNMGTSVQMLDLFYLRRLSAEMHADVLSEQPDAVKTSEMKKNEAKARKQLRKKGWIFGKSETVRIY